MNTKRAVVIVVAAACFALGFFCAASIAQEMQDAAMPAMPESPSDVAAVVAFSANGIVASISSNEVVLKEVNAESGEVAEVSYAIEPEVEIVNVDSLEAITPDTKLDVSYVVEDGKKIAKVLAVMAEQPQEVPAQ